MLKSLKPLVAIFFMVPVGYVGIFHKLRNIDFLMTLEYIIIHVYAFFSSFM